MRSVSILTFVLIITAQVSFAAALDDIGRVKEEISSLKEEISQLRLSVRSLDSYQGKMEVELDEYEGDFSGRFRSIIVPLLNWPAISSSTRVQSWIEHQHLRLVMDSLQERLIREPLELISDRELRLSRADDLRSELKETLKALELKESFLALELEELRMLRKKSKKGK
jgi:hypothetical protein